MNPNTISLPTKRQGQQNADLNGGKSSHYFLVSYKLIVNYKREKTNCLHHLSIGKPKKKKKEKERVPCFPIVSIGYGTKYGKPASNTFKK
jgi:hypothetical protein